MVKQLTFILLFSAMAKITAQENRTIISGKLYSEESSLENIHIYNKNSGKGTISNRYGQFTILVKVNDTIIISGIQFYKKEMLVTKQYIKNKLITIELFQKINELNEVEIKPHNLSGNLVNDAKNVKDSVSNVNPLALDFSKIDFNEVIVNDIDDVHNQRAPDASRLTNPNIPIGGDLKGPIINLINKIGKHRRHRKNEERVYNKKVVDAPEKMVEEFGEIFFTKTLKIPRGEITPFINHCKSRKILELYINNSKMEVIDILIKESEIYLNKLKE